ncbi:MAG: hypothetical protein HC905_21005 [Bacteroidales bacterium]|nr:hypothetical protein [Bacteroidales bacterium]
MLLIDGVDFSQPVFGAGGAAVINSALKNLHPNTILIGATSSSDHIIGQWQEIVHFNKAFRFLPVIHMEELIKPKVKSQNLQFALAVAKYIRKIKASDIRSVFTQTYTILWMLLLTPYSWDICFYYPGLGNPMLIGRRPKIGRLLACFYDVIQGFCANYTTVCFAAASEPVVSEYNRFLKKIRTKTIVKPLPTGVDTDLFRPKSKSETQPKTWIFIP